jgi:hypothetical protein
MIKTFYITVKKFNVKGTHATTYLDAEPHTIEFEKDDEIPNLLRIFVIDIALNNESSWIGMRWGYAETKEVNPYLLPIQLVDKKIGQHTWSFSDEREAKIAESLYELAKANGISVNHFQHLFPAILRMIGQHDIGWSKIN